MDRLGVKVRICRGEVLPGQMVQEPRSLQKTNMIDVVATTAETVVKTEINRRAKAEQCS